MAKQNVSSKNTTPTPIEETDKMVYLNTGIPGKLLTRIKKYQNKLGASSEQEAIRIGMNLILTMNGF
jgi:hypothetical protein